VNANSGATVIFIITPRKFDYLPIKVTAICDSAGDGIEPLLLVEPEGSPIYVNKAVILDLRAEKEKNVNIIIDTPSFAVPDSTESEVSVFGEPLLNTMENFDNLIRIPTGGSKENMVNLAQMIMVLDYLKAVQQLTPTIKTKILSYMETGYQNQLNYQSSDGSFSCNIWLTAYVVRYLAEAKVYITIDDNVLNRALDWLVSKQYDDGRFVRIEYTRPFYNGEYLKFGFKNRIS
jgi:uncharacterized protein YfaS (alpha-2-macroglobulin family)